MTSVALTSYHDTLFFGQPAFKDSVWNTKVCSAATDRADMPEYVTVHGDRVEVPCVYPAQLPGSKPPWEPAPKEPASQGQALYGETWLRRRDAAIQNRNVHLHEPDRQYKDEQRWLRSLEETVEGRRFQGGLKGTAWAEYWAAIPDQTKAELERDCQMPGDDQDDESDDESEYDSDAPDPSGDARRLHLKRDRVRNEWDLETYHYHVRRLENQLTAEQRNKYEDDIGDQERRKELDEVNVLFATINSPGFAQRPDRDKIRDEYQHKIFVLERLRSGATKDVVVAQQGREEQQAEGDRRPILGMASVVEMVMDNDHLGAMHTDQRGDVLETSLRDSAADEQR